MSIDIFFKSLGDNCLLCGKKLILGITIKYCPGPVKKLPYYYHYYFPSKITHSTIVNVKFYNDREQMWYSYNVIDEKLYRHISEFNCHDKNPISLPKESFIKYLLLL